MLKGLVANLLATAQCDVGVFADRGVDGFSRIIVPYLGQADDRGALRFARRIATNTGADVTVLHIVDPDAAPAVVEEREHYAKLMIEGTTALIKRVRHKSPSDAVLEESAAGYNLVVVGLGQGWRQDDRIETILTNSAPSVLVVAERLRVATPTGTGREDDEDDEDNEETRWTAA